MLIYEIITIRFDIIIIRFDITIIRFDIIIIMFDTTIIRYASSGEKPHYAPSFERTNWQLEQVSTLQ